MLKKTITFEDFNGETRTEDHYFNLTKAEIAEMELSREGGMTALIRRIVSEKNAPELASVFKEILKRTYGRKSDDGRRFMKSEEIWKNFEESGAYDVFFVELLQDAGKMSAFINGVVPKDMLKEVAKTAEEGGLNADSPAPAV